MRHNLPRGVTASLLVLLAAAAFAQETPPPPVSLEGLVTGWHTVRPGETMIGITSRYLGSSDRWRDNWSLNPAIQNPHIIQPGTRLKIILDFETAPPMARLRVVAGRVEARPIPIPWNQAVVEDVLVERDGIRTHKESSTEIEFRDGTNLVLSEESLVFVRPSQRVTHGPRKRSVEIVEGQAEVQALEPSKPRTDVEILVGSARATAVRTEDGLSQTRARKTEDGSAQVMVYEGASEVVAAGQSVEVPRGMGTAVREDAPPTPPEALLEAPVALLPAPESEWKYGDPWFAWEPVEGAASHTLEICADARCGDLVRRELGLADPRFKPEPLPAGAYHWRITAVSPSGLDGFPSAPVPFSVLFTGQDSEPPTGTLTISGRHLDRAGTRYWAPNARLEVDMTDDQSGVDSWAVQVDGQQLPEARLAGIWLDGNHVAKAVAVDRVGNLGETSPLHFTVDAAGPAFEIRLGGEEMIAEKLGEAPRRFERRRRKWANRYAPERAGRTAWTVLASGDDTAPLADSYDPREALTSDWRPDTSIELTGNQPGLLLFAAGRLRIGGDQVRVRHGDEVSLYDPKQEDGTGTVRSPVVWVGASDEGTGEVTRLTVSTEERAGESFLVFESEDVFGNTRRIELPFRALD